MSAVMFVFMLLSVFFSFFLQVLTNTCMLQMQVKGINFSKKRKSKELYKYLLERYFLWNVG
jgi:hypothetical protein